MVAGKSECAGVDKAIASFSFITFVVGFGQSTGPSLTGFLAEQPSSFFRAAAFAH
jgi:hypothetical protein